MNLPNPFPHRPTERRKVVIALQWLVVIGTSYLSVFHKGQVVTDPRILLLVVGLFASVLALQRLPDTVLENRFFPHVILLLDTALISLGIGLSQESPWDFYLLFFLCLFIAAIGQSMLRVILGCLMISLVFVVLRLSHEPLFVILESELLLRVPFIFGVSVVYGYLAEQVKVEKRRADLAEETEDLKRQLATALAHDIKNPLVVINVHAQLLAAQLGNDQENRQKEELLEGIQDNVRRISNLIASFLDVSAIEAGQTNGERAPVQLNRLMREVSHQYSELLRKNEISLEVDLDDDLPEFFGNEGQLERALWNLVGNAYKYTDVGGTITLMSRQNGDEISVSVRDTGMGIPEDEIPLLFKEFRRGKHTVHIPGTGLGLFIVKTIVEAHRGAIDVESEVGKGSTFTLRFPSGD